MDWGWGPLLFLRPPKSVRMTLRFWIKLFGISILFAAPIGAVLGLLLAYYDYASAQHHQRKIAPVVATEGLINSTPPGTALFYSALAIIIALFSCFCQHWAWNRRADRLNREGPLMPEAVAAAPGVWPPPPTVAGNELPRIEKPCVKTHGLGFVLGTTKVCGSAFSIGKAIWTGLGGRFLLCARRERSRCRCGCGRGCFWRCRRAACC